MPRTVLPPPFQLLEFNVISAQDLAQVSRKMRTYAVAWMNPDRKLSTRVDIQGHNNPTWNEKFVFRVDNEFLYGETSAIMIDIYALHWFRDIHVGTVRVIIGNLIPPPQIHQQYRQQHHVQLGTKRFVALQVRRRSGLPQGILNISVQLLDTSMRSMPLYSQISESAVGYRNNNNKDDDNEDRSSENQNQFLLPWIPKPEFRRTKSESSSMFGSDMVGKVIRKNTRQKASSMTGSEIIKKAHSPTIIPAAAALAKAKYGSGTLTNKSPAKTGKELNAANTTKNFQFGTLKQMNGKAISQLITESEPGASASEIVAMMAKNKNQYRVEETESEIMDTWSLESSMEGLQSKLERWRAELPPLYDLSELASYPASSVTGGEARYSHNRRHSHGDGAFSCFGTFCGIECFIVCGGSGNRKKQGRVKRSH